MFNKTAREKRYRDNLIAWQEYTDTHPETPFIEDQHDMHKIAFGGGIIPFFDRLILGKDKSEKLPANRAISARKNSCEVIALYNSFIELHGGESPYSFPDLLNRFEKKGILFGGLFGTSMRAIAKWLRTLPDYEVHFFNRRHLKKYMQDIYSLPQDETSEYTAFLVSFWNKKWNLRRGIHTVCVTKIKEGYALHNLYENNRIIISETLEDALLRAKGEDTAVCAIGIRMRWGRS